MYTEGDLTEQQVQYEQRIATVVGKRIAKIRYYDIAYPTGQPYWDNDFFHSLDFGLDLHTEDGSVFHIFWNADFYQFEISLGLGPLFSAVDNGIAIWEVSDHPKWQSLLHNQITKAQVYWSHVEFATWRRHDTMAGHVRPFVPSTQRVDYPQDLKLVFSSGEQVFFSAAQYLKDRDELFGISDEVTVIFSDEVAARYKVGPYAE